MSRRGFYGRDIGEDGIDSLVDDKRYKSIIPKGVANKVENGKADGRKFGEKKRIGADNTMRAIVIQRRIDATGNPA